MTRPDDEAPDDDLEPERASTTREQTPTSGEDDAAADRDDAGEEREAAEVSGAGDGSNDDRGSDQALTDEDAEDDEEAPAGEDAEQARAEDDEDEAGDDEDAAPEEGRGPAMPTGRRRPFAPSPLALGASAVLVLAGMAYGLNCWVNIQAAEDVRLRCGVAEEQVERNLADMRDQPLFASDWLMSLHRARRVYLREICGRTIDRLSWWRWNAFRSVEVRLSPHAQQDIERILVRASSSCESEIRDYESALQREMESQPVEPRVKTMVREMVEWQYASCRDLGLAVQGGFWPPLVASGPSEVPQALKRILPDSRMGIPTTGEDAQ